MPRYPLHSVVDLNVPVGNGASLFDFPGCVLVLTMSLAPIVTSLTWLGVRGTDPSGDEAARVIAGPWNTLWRVVLPQAVPSIALSAIIVFSLSLIEVAAPLFLRVDVYSTAVFARLGGFAFAPAEAAILALPLVALSFALWTIERTSPAHRVIALPTARGAVVPLLERAAPRTAAFLAVAATAGVGATPVIVMSVTAFQGDGFALLGTHAGNTVMNSTFYAASVSTVVVALGVIVRQCALPLCGQGTPLGVRSAAASSDAAAPTHDSAVVPRQSADVAFDQYR